MVYLTSPFWVMAARRQGPCSRPSRETAVSRGLAVALEAVQPAVPEEEEDMKKRLEFPMRKNSKKKHQKNT